MGAGEAPMQKLNGYMISREEFVSIAAKGTLINKT